MRLQTYQSLKVFQGLCGNQNLGAVVFAVTRFGKLTPEVAASRKAVLSDMYWKDFKKQGVIVFDLRPSHESACQLVDIVLNRVQKERVLLIQKELVDFAKKLPATEAAKELRFSLNLVITSDVTARLGWLTARLRHLADQKWL